MTITAAQAPPARPQPSKNNTPNKRKHISPPVLETNIIWSALFSRLAKAAALLALAAAVALGGPRSAEAARSGGRMGGSSFSSRPSYSSYSGGGGFSSSSYGGRSSWSSSSSSRSSSSSSRSSSSTRSYSSSSSFSSSSPSSSDIRSSLRRRANFSLIANLSASLGKSCRSITIGSSSPPVISPAAISSPPVISSPSPASVITSPSRSPVATNAFFFSPFGFGYPMGGGGGLVSLLFWGFFAVTMVQVVRGVLGNQSSSSTSSSSSSSYLNSGRSDERLSVAKVQVGLLGTARDLQKDLERIASKADTSSSRGLHYILQETVLSLLRNPNYCVYGFAKSGVENSPDEAESRFNKLSLEERGKFEKETRVNVGGRTGKTSLNIKKTLTTPVNELIVVTILVAIEGRLRLPKVTGRNQLIEALTSLGAVPSKDLLAVEILWTPEEEDDYFTQEDLASDYPLLNTL